MTDERTRLLAELEALRRADELAPGTTSIPYAIAEREAELAKLDAEPDWEAWRPALEAFGKVFWGSPTTRMIQDDTKRSAIRGLIAAAPLMPRDAGQSATTEALAAMEQVREALEWFTADLSGYELEGTPAPKALATLTKQIERMRNEQG
jgi:hypothetical protein